MPNAEDRNLAANVLIAKAMNIKLEADRLYKMSGQNKVKINEKLRDFSTLLSVAEWLKGKSNK